MSSLYSAMQEYNQDLGELETDVDKEKLKECNECGEPVKEGMILFPVKKACVTIQCGSCGTIYDEWREASE